MEIERKWKGNGMENLWMKFVDAKWKGNRVEMERKWNGKKEREINDISKLIWKWNGL